ncbi:YdeI family protein [Nocardioides sp. cx-173]|uniref:YdeI/OmpD-associated family protein n=1 Tax=Nocardioides sp. cx-173 TaxID=2898796 RepID=UPI001E3F0877|nr:hypothetical protein [Nocardioides sp. cx-173]MCD4523429.1 hypothetical protein [Nocardioides sp. cx-173]UGB42232.1 hypothetical protein LQ940_01585 [Nocardioides sp. cx-173]
MKPELDELLVPDAAAWRAWLLAHHDDAPGVWLVLNKKGDSVTELTYAAAVEEAVCFGWIDGQARRREGGGTFIRMTPRGRRSNWSVSNVERVERLDAEGRMHEAGWAAVDVAKANGRWDAALAAREGRGR